MRIVTSLAVFLCLLVGDVDAKYYRNYKNYKTISAITYNTALVDTSLAPELGLPENKAERLAQLIDSLQETQADVVCLQQVFLPGDVEAIVDGVSSVYEHSFSKIHGSDGTVITAPSAYDDNGCQPGDLSALLGCLENNGCLDLPTMEEALTCGEDNCTVEGGEFLTNGSESCFTCFFNNLFNTAFVTTTCIADPLTINTPGLLLLSKKNLTNTQFVEFFPDTREIVTRGYLTATVGGKLETVCTHLSVPGSAYPEGELTDRFSSYEEQNLFEVNLLAQTFGNRRRVLLLGDFSISPGGRFSIQAIAPANFRVLSAAFDKQTLRNCTLCPQSENAYNPEDVNSVTSHAFERGLKLKSLMRVFTPDAVTVPSDNGPLPLSDHFGVRVVFMCKFPRRRYRYGHRRHRRPKRQSQIL